MCLHLIGAQNFVIGLLAVWAGDANQDKIDVLNLSKFLDLNRRCIYPVKDIQGGVIFVEAKWL
jgi:hypothetical protein